MMRCLASTDRHNEAIAHYQSFCNALLADEFLEHFDGMSIGSNDMTQLTLGLDRDSGLVAGTFDERDPAMKAQAQA